MSCYIDIHTHNINSQHIAIVNSECPFNLIPSNLYSLGLHPWNICSQDITIALRFIENQLTIYKNIIAIGEIGIDRVIKTSVELQITLFRQQLQLAETFRLPIIIHCVRAYSDLLAEIKIAKPKIPWVFHGFNSNLTIAHKLLEKGCYLSFGVELQANIKLQDVFLQVPLEFVFFETDVSLESIELVYKTAAELRNMTLYELKTRIYQNFIKVFNNK